MTHNISKPKYIILMALECYIHSPIPTIFMSTANNKGHYMEATPRRCCEKSSCTIDDTSKGLYIVSHLTAHQLLNYMLIAVHIPEQYFVSRVSARRGSFTIGLRRAITTAFQHGRGVTCLNQWLIISRRHISGALRCSTLIASRVETSNFNEPPKSYHLALTSCNCSKTSYRSFKVSKS